MTPALLSPPVYFWDLHDQNRSFTGVAAMESGSIKPGGWADDMSW